MSAPSHSRSAGRPAARDPWFLVGWVVLQRDWDFTDGWGWERYDRAWDVWLSADDGQMWLKLSRLGRRPKDDPYL